MAMQLKYEGSFLRNPGGTCTVKIYQEANSAFSSVGELSFPADQPLVIEWDEAPIEQPVCGSTATLTIISETDREYVDLYTVTPGTVRMDVYIDNVLYWSGMLDTEFYSEPYKEESGYDVSFTFTDFGILDRLKYSGTGMDTVQNIVRDAVAAAGINVTGIDQTYISSYLGNTRATLNYISVRSDNFYDEDGEASTLREVVEGILQPLALKMIQRAGKVYVYDVNGLAVTTPTTSTNFLNDGVLGVDKVYNNARVIFSQYADGNAMSEPIKFSQEFDGNTTAADANFGTTGDYYTFPIYDPITSQLMTNQNMGFNIYPVASADGGIDSIHQNARYFHIQSIMDAEDRDGIINYFWTGGYAGNSRARKMTSTHITATDVLFTTKKIYLPPSNDGYLLRIQVPALFDTRKNPYEDTGGTEEQEIKDGCTERTNIVKVPVQIRLYNASGVVTAHYVNYVNPDVFQYLGSLLGSWESGDYPSNSSESCCFLWYGNGCPLYQWTNNRQRFTGLPNLSFLKIDDGQFLPYPAAGGYLEIKVTAGEVYLKNVGDTPDDLVESKVRWVLYGAPEVSICKNDATTSPLENKDIEYSGTLLADAKDELEIQTICGSFANGAIPSARGLYFDGSGNGITEMTRADRTKEIEHLLIGTLYTHYASRHLKLSGTTGPHYEALCLYQDPASPGRKLLMTGTVQDIIEGEESVTFVEVENDEYITEEEDE